MDRFEPHPEYGEVERTERIEVPLTPFTVRCGSVGVDGAGLGRELGIHEHVLLHDPAAGIYYTGIVADRDRTGSGRRSATGAASYRIRLGTRITGAEAAQWLEPEPRVGGRITTGEVARLLASLRRSQEGLRTAYRNAGAEFGRCPLPFADAGARDD